MGEGVGPGHMCMTWLPTQAGVRVTRSLGRKKNRQQRLENRKFQARPCLSNSKAEHGWTSSLKSQKSGGWGRRTQSLRPWEAGAAESRVPDQLGLHCKTLSQNNTNNKTQKLERRLSS